jgi:hypothetical protein
MQRAALAFVLLLLVTLSPCHLVTLSGAPARPQPGPLPIEVPIVGRPAEFIEAVGTKFEVKTRTDRSELYLGQSVMYTVSIKALGKFVRPPERPSLEELPKFTERFQIARSTSKKPDRVLDGKTWEFNYRLQPKTDAVARIPPLPVAYYRPPAKPGMPGHFFTTFGDEVELKIKPVVSKAPPPAKPIVAPAWLFENASGAELVRDAQPFTVPSFAHLGLLLLAPLAVGLLWFVAWRWLYPDAARRARIRRSRAAMEALRALDGAAAAPAERVAAIVAGYLRYRFDLPAAEPTPAEVADQLRQHAGTAKLADQAADFIRTCDVMRFAPAAGPGGTSDLVGSARQLIVSLEDGSWTRR